MKPTVDGASLREHLIAERPLVPASEVRDPPWVRKLPCLEIDEEARVRAEREARC